MAPPPFLKPPFSLTYELNPPHGTDPTKVLDQARLAAPFVDAFNLTDCPLSNLRMHPAPVAARIETDLHVPTIPHVTGRDRNVLALQSDLLAYAFLGVRHVFCLTGDPIHIGDHPKAKGVYELYANQIMQLVQGLNRGRDHAGGTIQPATRFSVGAAVTLTDTRPEGLDTFQKKIEAGADFFQTQIVLDAATLDTAPVRKFVTDRPVLVGTTPLKNRKMLDVLKTIPGVPVTETIERRLQQAPDFASEANRIVADLRDAVKGRYAGLHLMPINPDETQILALLRELRGTGRSLRVVESRVEDLP